MTATLFAVEFREACVDGSCPFCIIAARRTRRYIAVLLHEYATAPDTHERLAASRGLCERHIDTLLEVARSERPDGVPVAILYESVARTLKGELTAILEQAATRRRSAEMAARAARTLQPQRSCPVCEREDESEAYTRAAFWEAMQEGADNPIAAAFVADGGMCVRHLLRLLPDAPSREMALRLLEHARGQFARLAADLAAFVDKHSIGAVEKPSSRERSSWTRAARLCNGCERP